MVEGKTDADRRYVQKLFTFFVRACVSFLGVVAFGARVQKKKRLRGRRPYHAVVRLVVVVVWHVT